MNLPQFSANQIKLLLVIGLFFASMYGWLALHQNYSLPFHSEEWDHLLLAKQLPETRIPIGVNWEIGFQILIQELQSFTGLSYESIGFFMPVFVMFLASLGTFVLVRFLTKKILPALFSAILVLGLKSSITLLGFWFFVPMALAIAIMPLMIYFLIKAFNSIKFAAIFALLFIQATIFHPAFTIILIPAMILYSILNPQVFIKNQVKVAIGIILMLILLPFFAFQLGFVSGQLDLSFEGIKTISSGIINRLSWEKILEFEAKFSLQEFLGTIPFILAMLGFASIIVLKILSIFKPKHFFVESFFKNKHLFFISSIIFVLMALYSQFHLTNHIFFAPYERQFMALSFLLLLSAGIGLYYIIELFKNVLSNSAFFSENFFRLSVLGIIAVFFISLLSISTLEPKNSLYENVSESDLLTVQWVKEFNSEKNYVIALPWQSRIIKFFTEKKVYATSNARASEGVKENLLNFFLLSCEQKIVFNEKEKADLLVSKTEQSCDEWNKIYDKKDLSGYSFK
ncbi:MAG: hypothetical protein Q7S21_00155 [archaeon]|nr:hypothetical protein [archaeon]